MNISLTFVFWSNYYKSRDKFGQIFIPIRFFIKDDGAMTLGVIGSVWGFSGDSAFDSGTGNDCDSECEGAFSVLTLVVFWIKIWYCSSGITLNFWSRDIFHFNVDSVGRAAFIIRTMTAGFFLKVLNLYLCDF